MSCPFVMSVWHRLHAHASSTSIGDKYCTDLPRTVAVRVRAVLTHCTITFSTSYFSGPLIARTVRTSRRRFNPWISVASTCCLCNARVHVCGYLPITTVRCAPCRRTSIRGRIADSTDFPNLADCLVHYA